MYFSPVVMPKKSDPEISVHVVEAEIAACAGELPEPGPQHATPSVQSVLATFMKQQEEKDKVL